MEISFYILHFAKNDVTNFLWILNYTRADVRVDLSFGCDVYIVANSVYFLQIISVEKTFRKL